MFPGGNMIGAEEEQAVLEVIRSKKLARYHGYHHIPSKVAQFEAAFATHMGVAKAFAVTSGTAALMCGLAGIGIEPGDEVIVPGYAWLACASTVVVMGAIPIIAEVDDSLNLDPADVMQKITPRTRAIMPVHMRGAPAQMDDLLAIARQHGLRVIEDVAQACGGSYRGRRLGTLGDVGCFSFDYYKMLTCGEGGVVLAASDEIGWRVFNFSDSAAALHTGLPDDNSLVGINFRMPELCGAVALVQIQLRLEDLLAAMRQRKRRLKEGISEMIRRVGGQFRRIHDVEGDAATALIFFMPVREQAQFVIQALQAENIAAMSMDHPKDTHVYVAWREILEKRSWTSQGTPWRWGAPVEYRPDMCPQTLDLLSRAVYLNVNPLLSLEEFDEIAAGVNKVLAAVAERR